MVGDIVCFMDLMHGNLAAVHGYWVTELFYH